MPKHVALLGKAQSGKDTVGQTLVRHAGYTRLAFADKLKDAALRVDPIIGWTHDDEAVRLAEEVEYRGWESVKAEDPEVRRFLQEYGQTVREMDPEFWIRPVAAQIRNGTALNMPTVVTDVRYLNEVDALRELGAVVVRIVRTGAGLAGTAGKHASETELDAVEADVTISNDGSLYALTDNVRILYRHHLSGE
jgi:hypothetical protein